MATRGSARLILVPLLTLGLSGCLSEVVLHPDSDVSSGVRLPITAKLDVGEVTALSKVKFKFDVKPALLSYAEKRETFQKIVDGPSDVVLKVSAKFTLTSTTVFAYTFKLRGQLMTADGRTIGRYTSEGTANGGMSRFTSSDDTPPMNDALGKAFDKLFGAIESDRLQIMVNLGKEPVPAAAAPLFAGASAAAIVSDVDAPKYKKDENPDDFALVIGIEKYESLPSADFAEHDAASVRSHLIALGYPERNIIYLTGAKASKTGIEKYVGTWLPLNVKDDSSVFVYFSGHGAPDPSTGQAYLVPWDGDAKFLKDTGYPLQQLYAKLASLKAKRVLVAMDSCFSGEGGRSVLAKGARPLVTKVDVGVAPGGNLVVFAAAGGDEITGTEEGQGHGLFTYYFLKGLDEKKGETSIKGLFDYLTPRIQDAARRDGREQTPQLMPPGLGDRANGGLR